MTMKTIVRVIDSISEGTGKIIHWACVALIVLMCFEVTARYVFNSPTIWSFELGRMLGVTIAFMGWAYTHRHHGHVRIDVFYTRLSARGKAITDIIGALLFFFPLLFLLTYTATKQVEFSWFIHETLMESYWYPPALPIRIVVLLGIFLFTIQGAAQFTRDLYQVIRNKPL